MTLEQLYQRNEKFQQKATEISELIPGSALFRYSASLIRSVQKLDKHLKKALTVTVETRFYQNIEAVEDEMDELVYILDKLDMQNRNEKIGMINDFLKGGYELLSLYSMCCDQVIELKAKQKDEIE